MAHIAQTHFVKCIKDKFPQMFDGRRVLEVGSYNVNGSVRSLFERCYYVGIDIMPGDGVDVVCSGDKFKSEYPFDVVISCEMLEHNPFWEETLHNMYGLLKDGGMMILSCAAPGRSEHGTQRTADFASPSSNLFGDYYRNLTPEEIMSVFSDIPYRMQGYCTEYHKEIPEVLKQMYPTLGAAPQEHDTYMVGWKTPAGFKLDHSCTIGKSDFDFLT